MLLLLIAPTYFGLIVILSVEVVLFTSGDRCFQSSLLTTYSVLQSGCTVLCWGALPSLFHHTIAPVIRFSRLYVFTAIACITADDMSGKVT